jgi:hypothetical protein
MAAGSGVEPGQWYWFFKDWGRPPKHRPWIIAKPPDGFRQGLAFPRTTSELDKEQRFEHERHYHDVPTCRLDEPGAIVRAETLISADDLSSFSCTEPSFEVCRTIKQWGFFAS